MDKLESLKARLAAFRGGCGSSCGSWVEPVTQEAANAISDLQRQLETVAGERDTARAYAGLGCEANVGGEHEITEREGDRFCHKCGYSIPKSDMRERARKAEARAVAAEQKLAKAVEALERIGRRETSAFEAHDIARATLTELKG